MGNPFKRETFSDSKDAQTYYNTMLLYTHFINRTWIYRKYHCSYCSLQLLWLRITWLPSDFVTSECPKSIFHSLKDHAVATFRHVHLQPHQFTDQDIVERMSGLWMCTVMFMIWLAMCFGLRLRGIKFHVTLWKKEVL